MGRPAVQRTRVRVVVGGVMVASALLGACSFDSGGVGGQGTALGEGDSTAAEGSTGAVTTGGGPVDATTQGSADGTTGGSDGGSSSAAADESSSGAPFDPCAVDNGGCDPDASCTPDPSGEVAVCDCNEGFEGNGMSCVVTPSLAMLRVEAACDLTAFDSCTTDDAHQEAPMIGEPGTLYVVTLRVRGVVERKTYEGGEPDGLWHPNGEPGDVDLWNEATLTISETAAAAAQVIRLNSGSSGDSTLVVVDMTHDVVIEAGAVVGLTLDSIDGGQIRNHDNLVVDDIPPAPDAFDGQFLQIDVLAISALE